MTNEIRNPLADDSDMEARDVLSENPGRRRKGTLWTDPDGIERCATVITHREIALHILENAGDAERVLRIITG